MVLDSKVCIARAFRYSRSRSFQQNQIFVQNRFEFRCRKYFLVFEMRNYVLRSRVLARFGCLGVSKYSRFGSSEKLLFSFALTEISHKSFSCFWHRVRNASSRKRVSHVVNNSFGDCSASNTPFRINPTYKVSRIQKYPT